MVLFATISLAPKSSFALFHSEVAPLEQSPTAQENKPSVTPAINETRIQEQKNSTAFDRDRIAAQQVTEEARLLSEEGSATSLRKALEKYAEALLLWRAAKESRGEGDTLFKMGVIHWQLGESQKSLEYYSPALEIWRAQSNRREEARVLHSMGVSYWQLGESQKALQYYGQALPLRRLTADRQGEAITLNSTGLAHDSLGQLREALEYYNQALSLQRKLGNERDVATTLSNIGASYFNSGELQMGLEYLLQALALRRQTGDKRGEAATLNNIGVAYWQLGENERALEAHNEALPLRRETGDRNGEVSTLQNFGIAYLALNQPQKALEYHNQALTLARTLSDRRAEATILQNMGTAYRWMNNFERALDHYNQALRLRRDLSDRRGEANTLSRIGTLYSLLGQPDKGRPLLEQALLFFQTIGDRANQAATLQALATAERDQNQLTAARSHIESALTIIESIHSQTISRQLRTSFLASRQSFYELEIDLLMRLHNDKPSAGHDVRAFEVNERARARGLLELLAEARTNVRQGIAPALKEREAYLQSRTTWVQSQLIQANVQVKPDAKRIAALEEQFKDIEGQSEQLETDIRKNSPDYAALRYPRPLGLKDVQQSLDERTLLLEYSLGKDSSYLFAISKTDFVAVRLPDAPLIKDQVATLREAISTKPNRLAVSHYLQTAASLYGHLIQPANRLLTGKQSLIIVPDGVLHYLPFEVLLQSDASRQTEVNFHRLPYLVRTHSISYSPSATVLAKLTSADRKAQGPSKMLLAYGDPNYGNASSEQGPPARSALDPLGNPWKLQPLPESRREVQHVARLYPAGEADVFLGEQATEENVKLGDRSSQYRFVHFAVHGLLNENKPQYSGLVLSLPNGENAKPGNLDPKNNSHGRSDREDGLLQVYEIFNLKLNADLVVLSGCETGLGKETKGEGLVGLTQAFFYAGTPSLAVSLWKVQDRSTAELMVSFYRHLRNPSLTKSQALQRAQLEMIKSRDFAHPYYWAGFVLVGRP